MFEIINFENYESSITQMQMYFVVIGLLFTLPIILINRSIKYGMKKGKNRDVLKRRIFFFSGLIILFVLVVLPGFGIFGNLKGQMAAVIESDEDIIIPAIDNAFTMCLLFSVVAYISLYVLVAYVASLFKQYKQMTVFRSNNKFFGLF
jgi:hypothetical protein